MKRRNRIQATLHRAFARALVLCPIVFVLVAGAGCPSLFDSPTQRATHIQQAIAGRDGDRNVTTANTVVNVYAKLAGTPTTKTITVTDVNTNFLGAVSQGDLLLIVQMAGATMDVSDTATYGAVSQANLGNAGRYEFVGVDSVSSNTITLACELKNTYSPTGKAQVIRVPQYNNLTISGAAASITARAWDGVTGGVVAVHAERTLDLSGSSTGSIDVSGKGFRGGSTVNDNVSQAAATEVLLYTSSDAHNGAEKGEGIAGYQADYEPTSTPAIGRYGRGAPANGGGGGNSHNAGGGGGANASSGVTWTGQGVMTVSSANDATAWALEPGYSSAKSVPATASEGGGRGGYSYSGNNQNPLTDAPGTCAGGTSWGGNCRRDVGGLGGRPVANNPAGDQARLFMGGGGGAGDGNNGATGPGGKGGGLVFLIAGSVTSVAGDGSIHADGEAGHPSIFANGDGLGADAAGGGGGGGTVVVHAASLAATVSIFARGGGGGDQQGSGSQTEAEGPGGGGGGGYIAVSGGTPTTMSAARGSAGTTDRTVMTNFQVDGATAGNDGQIVQIDGDATSFKYCGIAAPAAPVATILSGPTEQPNQSTTSTTATFFFQATELGITEAGVTLGDGAVVFECKLDSGAFARCVSGPSGYTIPTALGVGHHTFTVTATDLSGNTSPVSIWAWDVIGLGLDGGVLDAQVLDAQVVDTQSPDTAPALDTGVDGGGLDGTGGEVGPAFLDAQGIDAGVDVATSDVFVLIVDAGTAKLDVLRDLPGTTNQDTVPSVSVDASVDGSASDILLPVIDAGSRSDAPDGLQPLPIDTAAVEALGDATSTSDVAPNPDTALAPNPDLNPDVAPVAIEDAAVAPTNKDAAVVAPPTDIKVMGSGFCAIASSRSTTSAPFLVMALAALALLRRRRQR